jgi:hypothetical protein
VHLCGSIDLKQLDKHDRNPANCFITLFAKNDTSYGRNLAEWIVGGKVCCYDFCSVAAAVEFSAIKKNATI